VPRALRAGGERLTLRGDALRAPSIERVLSVARAAGWTERIVRTHGVPLLVPGAAQRLRALGASGVLVPVFSHVSAAHDAVAGTSGSLVATLRAMRMAADAGLAVHGETPLLEGRLQDLSAIIDLCHRATHAFTRVRFYVPRHPMPASLAPPRWGVARARLIAAIERAASLGVTLTFEAGDGVPPCVLGHEATTATHVKVPSSPLARRPDGFALGARCQGCSLAPRCVGPTLAYHAAHQDADLEPFVDRVVSATRTWSEAQREAARHVTNWVLRPTIHCNQDCPFCSANETSANVLTSDVMLRRIARAARKGVRYLSFGGGEPTLSKDLIHYVRAASRLGIKDIELVTNGVLLDGVEKVRPFREAGLNRAFVSLHGHDELVSRRATSKVGDHARTVRAIDALIDCGVDTEINHVISAINHPYLPRFARFVADRWRRRVGVSFAFVTPQFKALDTGELVPRISEVVPYLRRAMRTLIERDTPFTVGSRQGIPPCFLGEYTPWSDVVHVAARARAEDEPQKVRAPACERCRFTRVCMGVWKPYAARYGLDELVPVPGEVLRDDEVDTILHTPFPPRDFDLAPAPLRAPRRDDPELLVTPRVEQGRVRLPVLGAPRDALRIVMLGTGAQALRLSRALATVPDASLVGLSSPHIDDRDTGAFGVLDRDADAERLVARVRPDAVIIAAATTAHVALARAALDRGLPVLVEKPLARSLAEATALAQHPEVGRVMMAHALRFTPALTSLREATSGARITRVRFERRAAPGSPERFAAWSRDALREGLYHAVATLASLAGGGAAEVLRVDARRTPTPEWFSIDVRFASGIVGEIVWDCTHASDRLEVRVHTDDGTEHAWTRDREGESLTREGPTGRREHSVEPGSDTEAMLRAFCDAVRSGAPSPVGVREGVDVLATTGAMLDALAPWMLRPGAPRHAASVTMKG
jgi:predicted dehydrogenase/MoaA/NifB/PqqE/SkfB family radical SAM enzyme